MQNKQLFFFMDSIVFLHCVRSFWLAQIFFDLKNLGIIDEMVHNMRYIFFNLIIYLSLKENCAVLLFFNAWPVLFIKPHKTTLSECQLPFLVHDCPMSISLYIGEHRFIYPHLCNNLLYSAFVTMPFAQSLMNMCA